jgi:predicted membrane GTPase involved in stress response
MGQPGQSEQLPLPPHKKLQKCEALQYCDSNEFIELTVGTLRVLISKAATNNICSNKHKP